MVWDRAQLLSLLCKSAVTNTVRPDKKRQRCPPFSPSTSPPRAGSECDAATHKPVGYQPQLRPHSPGRSRALLSRDAPRGFVPPSRSPSHCGYLLKARERGRAWDGGVGPGRGGGVGWVGGHHRSILGTVRDHHCLPSHPVTYCYQTAGLTSRVFLRTCDSTEKKEKKNTTLLDVWSWHPLFTRALDKRARTRSFSQKHTLSIHRHTVITTGASQEKPTHRIESGSSSSQQTVCGRDRATGAKCLYSPCEITCRLR